MVLTVLWFTILIQSYTGVIGSNVRREKREDYWYAFCPMTVFQYVNVHTYNHPPLCYCHAHPCLSLLCLYVAENAARDPIPAALVDTLLQSEAFGVAISTQQQIFYAFLSLKLHQVDPYYLNITEFVVNLTQAYSPFDFIDGSHFVASFGHLDGYGPLYYTYQWSLGIADDMFYTQFCPDKMEDEVGVFGAKNLQ